jgi:hypothetical protein
MVGRPVSVRTRPFLPRPSARSLGRAHNLCVSARLLLAFACVVAAAAAAAAAAPPTPQPATLVLRRADVGRAYTGRAARVSNADAARGAPPGFAANLARWGRIGGYEIDFRRSASPSTLQDGPLAVTSSASVYRSQTGARAAFAYARRHLVPGGYAPLALGFALGDEARLWVSQGDSHLGTMLQYVLIWRTRNIDASIVVTGRVGVVSAFDVAPLARRQQARIRAALR